MRNASSLAHALRNATVRGIRLSELEKNTYATEEVEKDIKRLIDEGAVVAIPRSDLPAIGPRKGEKVGTTAAAAAAAAITTTTTTITPTVVGRCFSRPRR